MEQVRRNRQRVLAGFLPASVALLVIGEVLTPKKLDRVIMTKKTALTLLPVAAAHLDRLYISNALVLLGLAAFGVSFGAIATLVTGRGATIATAAAVLGGLGAFCGAIANVLVGFNLAAVVSVNMTPDAAAAFLVATFRSDVGNGFLLGYFFGLIFALILMVVALWRSRTVPRWLPFLFAIGFEVAASAPAGLVALPLMLPFAVAMVFLTIRIWRAAGIASPAQS